MTARLRYCESKKNNNYLHLENLLWLLGRLQLESHLSRGGEILKLKFLQIDQTVLSSCSWHRIYSSMCAWYYQPTQKCCIAKLKLFNSNSNTMGRVCPIQHVFRGTVENLWKSDFDRNNSQEDLNAVHMGVEQLAWSTLAQRNNPD